jgi:Tfp pilus assembly protein PilX
MTSKEATRGQVLLITLLVLLVAMTIGLSLIGRSKTNVQLSTDVEESARAFSAAEAGIEEALKSGLSTSGVQTLSGTGTQYETNVSAIGSAVGAFAVPQITPQGVTETIWLVNHDANGNLVEFRAYFGNQITVCWNSVGTTVPALSVALLYKKAAGGAYNMAKFAADGVSRTVPNNFTSVTTGVGCGQSSVYKITISFPVIPNLNFATDTLLALRIRPIYADAQLYIDSGAALLPRQGNMVTSSGSTGGGLSRKIQVYQQYRSAPSIFDAAIISQSTLVH